MDPRILLMTQALASRSHSNELQMAARVALMNAEALEEIIVKGTDAEILEAIRILESVR